MHSEELSYPSFDFEKEIERAKWFKDDLEKGGWREAYKGPVSQYWIKTFPDEEVPIKILFTFDMPMPAKVFSEMISPSVIEDRNKWETGIIYTKLEEYPNGNKAVFARMLSSWPISDRGFVVLFSPMKEIDWYGKKAFLCLLKNFTHPSKPEGGDGLIRAYNGGNFFVATPDDNYPEKTCKVFSLTNNLYKGWLPDSECLMARLIPPAFNKIQEDMIKGYEKTQAKEEN